MTLPTASDISYTGYVLKGWCSDENAADAFDPTSMTVLAPGASVTPTESITYTAIWALSAPTNVTIEVTEGGGSTDGTNDGAATYGTSVQLNATHDSIEGDNTVSYEYKWYKEGSDVVVSYSKNLSLKNVAESGNYTVAVSAMKTGFAVSEPTPCTQTVAITPAVLSVTANSGLGITKEYDGTTDVGATYALSTNLTVQGLQYSDAASVNSSSWAYTSADVGSAVTINITGLALAYGDNTASGNYTYTPTTVTITGAITQKDITGQATIAAIPTQAYTGAAITPNPTVTLGTGDDAVRLVKGTDYTLSYQNNIDEADGTGATAPTVTVHFIGNYTGTDATATFVIQTATVLLRQGNQTLAQGTLLDGTVTNLVDENDAPYTPAPGVYDLVVQFDGNAQATATVVSKAGDPITAALPTSTAGQFFALIQTFTQVAAGCFTTNMLTDSGKDALAQDNGIVVLNLFVEEKNLAADGAEESFAEDAALIDNAKSGKQLIGMYLDLALWQSVSAESKLQVDTQITELPNGKLQVVIPLPESAQGQASYTVYRVHEVADANGGTTKQVETITTSRNTYDEYLTVNGDKTVLTMYINRMSTFAITYTKAEVNAGATVTTTQTSAALPTSPATGDPAGTMLWVLLPVAVLFGTTLCLSGKRKNRSMPHRQTKR